MIFRTKIYMFFLTIIYIQIIIPFNTNYLKHCQHLGGSVLNVICLLNNKLIEAYTVL
jgi:hypothetical protein